MATVTRSVRSRRLDRLLGRRATTIRDVVRALIVGVEAVLGRPGR
jgi:hypothetical protein